MDEGKKIVEINGIKVEVDLRTAKIVESYRVGDPVKVLHKHYGDVYEVLPGAIVGFSQFEKLPTIEVLCVTRSGDVQFIAFNAQTKDLEIAPFNKYEIAFDYASIVGTLESVVRQKREELRNAEAKLKAFNESFAKVFDLVDNIEARR